MFQMNVCSSFFYSDSISLIYVALKYKRQSHVHKTFLKVFAFHVRTRKVWDLKLKMHEIVHFHWMLMFIECQAEGSALARLHLTQNDGWEGGEQAHHFHHSHLSRKVVEQNILLRQSEVSQCFLVVRICSRNLLLCRGAPSADSCLRRI